MSIGCGGDGPVDVKTAEQVSPLALEAASKGVDFSAQTDDFKDIKGTFYDIGGTSSVILVHMMGKDRSTWDGLVPLLLNQGYNVVTIDLRGHGDSSGDWNRFVRQEFSDMHLDVKAAADFLDERGVTGDRVLIGASIGANAVLKYATSDEDVTSVVLLSPGIDYRGLTTSDTIGAYSGRLFFAVSEDDLYSQQSATKLFGMAKVPEEDIEYKQYDGKAHGTDMLVSTTLADDMIAWLRLD